MVSPRGIAGNVEVTVTTVSWHNAGLPMAVPFKGLYDPHTAIINGSGTTAGEHYKGSQHYHSFWNYVSTVACIKPFAPERRYVRGSRVIALFTWFCLLPCKWRALSRVFEAIFQQVSGCFTSRFLCFVSEKLYCASRWRPEGILLKKEPEFCSNCRTMATLAMTNANDEDELKNDSNIATDKPDNELEDSDHPDEDYKVLTTSTGRGCGPAGCGRGRGRGRTRHATTDVTVADDTFDARINKYPGYQGRHGPTEFPPQDADLVDFFYLVFPTDAEHTMYFLPTNNSWFGCTTYVCTFLYLICR